jgi:hypothetical protein
MDKPRKAPRSPRIRVNALKAPGRIAESWDPSRRVFAEAWCFACPLRFGRA